MKVVHKQDQLPPNATKAPISVAIAHLTEAHKNGELTFTRSITYRMQTAPPGFVFYKIKYQTDTALIYDGAWKMDLAIEKKLEAKPGQLEKYLIGKFAPEITE